MKYIALFRGINVGGKNLVKMADLRAMLTGLGLAGVRTYIQSGNALFESDETESALKGQIERGFRAAFGFDCAVLLRTAGELAAICDALPFTDEEIAGARAAAAGAESLYCFLLNEPAPAEIINGLNAADGRDRLVAGRREIYLLCYQSVRDSKLAASLERLKLPMTARNLKTLLKLRGMMDA